MDDQRHIYVEEKAQELIKKVQKELYVKVATCDAPNWDVKLHHTFPYIADRLRELDYVVSSRVNHGVTDWVITKKP